MSKYSNAQELAGLTLGQKTEYSNHYDSSLLHPVPRSLNRDDLHLGDTLPFIGCDIWTMYEVSWLNKNGLPQVAVGEVSVPATSHNLIESKSFKLYLNSFNQTHFDNWDDVQNIIASDLSACAGEKVDVTLRALEDYTDTLIVSMDGDCIDDQDISIEHYDLRRDLLQDSATGEVVEESLHSHLLKSNCLITNQPDWGSIEIQYKGKKINREALLRYIISFREHNEFHEQCVERIFTDIIEFCQPSELTVFARYTRRGGLDINPYRSNVKAQPNHNQRMARQ